MTRTLDACYARVGAREKFWLNKDRLSVFLGLKRQQTAIRHRTCRVNHFRCSGKRCPAVKANPIASVCFASRSLEGARTHLKWENAMLTNLDHELLKTVGPPALLFAVLGLTLLPHAGWQSLLVRLLSITLRLFGLATVGVGAALYFDWLTLPEELFELLNEPQPNDYLLLTTTIVLILLPILALLSFTRRLFRTARRVESLVATGETVTAVAEATLALSDDPGAPGAPQRRDALAAALHHPPRTPNRPGDPASTQPTVIRKTLAQLIG